ncbi:MAG: CRTAC1 family protein [bacterium]|nr:CRTAC1 family protein [bacterium]
MRKIFVCISLLIFGLAVNFSNAMDFKDVTNESGTGDPGRGKGVAVGDFNNDGLLDFYVSNKGGGNVLFQNMGGMKFKDVTVQAGVNEAGYSLGSCWGDINNDGYLDLYVPKGGVYEVESNRLFLNNGDGTFTDITATAGVGTKSFSYGSAMADVDHDGYLDIFCANYGPNNKNVLYHNNGNNTFTEVTDKAGLGDLGWCWSATFADVNGDGFDDLYVVHGRYPAGERNKLYLNNGDGTFKDFSKESGTDDPNWGLGATFADADNDGDLDLFVSNYQGGNKFFLNDGTGHFKDYTKEARLDNYQGWGKGPIFADFDHDGYLDLYEADCKGPNHLYKNNGKGIFTDITDKIPGINCGTVKRSKGVAVADFDNDGDMDLYVVNWNTPNRLFKNTQNDKNFLKVSLEGRASNRSAVGSWVKVYDAGHLGDMKYFRGLREVTTASGFCSMSSLDLHFGLDASKKYDLDIKFTNGTKVVMNDVSCGQTLKIKEPAKINSIAKR